jgi:hypothetical protein
MKLKASLETTSGMGIMPSDFYTYCELLALSDDSALQMGKENLLRFDLEREGITAGRELIVAIQNVFSRVQEQDCYLKDGVHQIDPEKLRSIAAEVGLKGEEREIPWRLFQSHCARVKAESDAARAAFKQPTDDEIVEFLTNSNQPIENFFYILGHGICHWGGFATLSIDKVFFRWPLWEKPCEEYLIRRGAIYRSLREALEKAKRENWPNWEEVERRTVSSRHYLEEQQRQGQEERLG